MAGEVTAAEVAAGEVVGAEVAVTELEAAEVAATVATALVAAADLVVAAQRAARDHGAPRCSCRGSHPHLGRSHRVQDLLGTELAWNELYRTGFLPEPDAVRRRHASTWQQMLGVGLVALIYAHQFRLCGNASKYPPHA